MVVPQARRAPLAAATSTWRRSTGLLISSGNNPPNRHISRRDGFHHPSRPASRLEPLEVEHHLHGAVVVLAQVHHPRRPDTPRDTPNTTDAKHSSSRFAQSLRAGGSRSSGPPRRSRAARAASRASSRRRSFDSDAAVGLELFFDGDIQPAVHPVEPQRRQAAHRPLAAQHRACQDLVLGLVQLVLGHPIADHRFVQLGDPPRLACGRSGSQLRNVKYEPAWL